MGVRLTLALSRLAGARANRHREDEQRRHGTAWPEPSLLCGKSKSARANRIGAEYHHRFSLALFHSDGPEPHKLKRAQHREYPLLRPNRHLVRSARRVPLRRTCRTRKKYLL